MFGQWKKSWGKPKSLSLGNQSGEKLVEYAREMGLFPYSSGNEKSFQYGPITIDRNDLERRIFEAERAIRESRIWIIALLSALASVVSAAAAWLAVYSK